MTITMTMSMITMTMTITMTTAAATMIIMSMIITTKQCIFHIMKALLSAQCRVLSLLPVTTKLKNSWLHR